MIRLVTACLFACGLLIGVLLPYPALADVGPVWTAQGADIEPGEEPTQVQMVSETASWRRTMAESEPEDPTAVLPASAGRASGPWFCRACWSQWGCC